MGLPEIIICCAWRTYSRLHHSFFLEIQKRACASTILPPATGISENDNWKLKYYNDMDMQERAQQQLRERLNQAGERADPDHRTGRKPQRDRESASRDLDDSRKELEEPRYTAAGTARAEEATAAAELGRQMTPESAPSRLSFPASLRTGKTVEHNSNIHRLLEHTICWESRKRRTRTCNQNEAIERTN